MAADRIEQPILEDPVVSGLDDLLRWAASLPWVVQRPTDASFDLRTFAIDCEPLGHRRLWLVVGAGGDGHPASVSVIVPAEAADLIEQLGWGRRSLPMPNRLEVVKACSDATSASLVALLLTAYQYAMR